MSILTCSEIEKTPYWKIHMLEKECETYNHFCECLECQREREWDSRREYEEYRHKVGKYKWKDW